METIMNNTEPRHAIPGSIRSQRSSSRADWKVAHRTEALFRAISTDTLLREQFVTDPAQIMSDYLFTERPSEEAIDASNQLIYAVMSSQRLRNWAIGYGAKLNGATPSRDAFALEFAHAIAHSGDELAAVAVIRGAADKSDHFILQADLLRAIVTVLGGRLGVSGREMSPGHGTEMSPGVGTEMSPGRIFAGTEMSPGHGTEMSPGVGTEMSPGRIFAGTEMSPGHGTEMSPGVGTEMSPGRIFAGTEMSPGRIFAGTEMSPGLGTEMSPGVGTEMSPGQIFGGGLAGHLGHLAVTLNALTRYATALRVRGALLSTGLEGR
jgi:hypothetical protein